MALLALKAAISNWPSYAAANGLSGWGSAAEPGAPCTWSCVACDGKGRAARLEFNAEGATWHLAVVGTLPPQLAMLGALNALYFGGQNLTGTLPLEWGAPGAFPALTTLNLGQNTLTGTLPAAWATPGSFPALQTLELLYNNFFGQLPEAWGATPGAFPVLSSLYMGHNNFSGHLPPVRASASVLDFCSSGQYGHIDMWAPQSFLYVFQVDLNERMQAGDLARSCIIASVSAGSHSGFACLVMQHVLWATISLQFGKVLEPGRLLSSCCASPQHAQVSNTQQDHWSSKTRPGWWPGSNIFHMPGHSCRYGVVAAG